jgi:hypothetical protein
VHFDSPRDAALAHQRNVLKIEGIRKPYKRGELSNNVCSICHDRFGRGDQDHTYDVSNEDEDPEKEMEVLECGHVFHTNCLVAWLKSERTCPVCRKPVSQADLDAISGARPGAGLRSGADEGPLDAVDEWWNSLFSGGDPGLAWRVEEEEARINRVEMEIR